MEIEASPDPTELRQRAHVWLDDYLDELLAREDAALRSESPQEAHDLFQLGLEFVRRVVGPDIVASSLPRVLGTSPFELRQALIDIIFLLAPVWPHLPAPVGWRTTSEGLTPNDVVLALQKLDFGETPPIFEAAKVNLGKHKFTERRYWFLAALWAMHSEYDLKTPDGKKSKSNVANNCVARAFQNVGEVPWKNGYLPDGQVEKWRRHIEAVAAGKIHDPAISSSRAIWGINFTKWVRAHPNFWESRVDVSTWTDAQIAQHIHHIATGEESGCSTSLVEAGRRYRDFMELKESDRDTRAKREQRSKPLKKNGDI